MKKIGIIGAGIGGLSVGYFLSKHDKNVEITIYDKLDSIGGRIKTISFQNKKIDIGAIYFHETNETMVRLVKELNLHVHKQPQPSKLLFWNGEDTYANNFNNIFFSVKLLVKYGKTLFFINREINKLKKKLQVFYRSNKPLKSLNDLIQEMKIRDIYKLSIKEFFIFKKWNIEFLELYLIPILRVLYSCAIDNTVNTFVVIMALLSVLDSNMYSITGGNDQICSKLIETINCNLKLGTKINKITKIDDEYGLVMENGSVERFDLVIVATPILDDSFITDSGYNNNITRYSSLYKYIIKGQLNTAYFTNKNRNKTVPTSILTPINKNSTITSISLSETVAEDIGIYTLNSCTKLDDELLTKIFSKIESEELHIFEYTFPMLTPINNLPAIKLNDNLFYLNGIELIMPMMEFSVLMASNVVRLITNSDSNF